MTRRRPDLSERLDRRGVLAALGLALAACSSDTGVADPTILVATSTPTATTTPDRSITSGVATSAVVTSSVLPPPTPAEPAPTTVAAATTTIAATSPAPALPKLGGGTTRYRVPVADVEAAGWADTHTDYPASDVFAGGCGAALVSPVDGVVAESRRVNAYDPAVDNPATRGGRSVTIIGDDGARYYLAHFERIEDGIEPGVRVEAGTPLGEMGQTGRASACHVHFGISPPCPGREWAVRRGVVWPYPYLDDWRFGGQRSPVAELQQWIADHPTACDEAIADPQAADS